MRIGADILENEIIERYPGVLDIILCDHTTDQNIFWATDNYQYLGETYSFNSQILPELISGKNGDVIMPRVKKNKVLQKSRSKEMAEVFTPSWICNAQNNIIDNAWFGRKNIFNQEIVTKNGAKSWKTHQKYISFPENKSWLDYILDTRLEISCGEAPYLVSRYDTTTGKFIPIENRIGLLDRKLRIVNENTNSIEEWLNYVQSAYESIYAYEWQGDSLLLAREAMLITFIENFNYKFGIEPDLEPLKVIANIISWNVWQMDGLKGVVPNSCTDIIVENDDLFGSSEKEIVKCKGCETQNILLHNGKYCIIMDWEKINIETGRPGVPIKFIDLLKK